MPMSNSRQIEGAEKFQIQAYKRPKDIRLLRENNVSFTGTPQKHPYDSKKVIIVADPYSTDNFYYEFSKDDITFVEELPNVVDSEGCAFTMVRVWVKKMSVGVKCAPFIVEDTRSYPKNAF
jgi:inorganic pyrophosphatase